jgi:2-methylisocitrate lyase-like PEP mutase family enzyme
MRVTTTFRRLIVSPDILLMPGAHDVLSAKIAEQAGFEVITMGGYSASATLLGQPDTSQLSFTEMVDHYARMCDAVSIPVFGDGDTGFGNETNAARTVRQYERAGLAGMFLEDQVFPKRCGHMTGKDVIPAVEMASKLKAALDAREDPDFVIMARTDAIAVNGLDDAMERMALYREVGADLLFVEAPKSIEDMTHICRELDGPCFAHMIEGGSTPVLSLQELADIGFACAAYPVAATYTFAKLMQEFMAHMKAQGTSMGFEGGMLSFDEFNQIVGLEPLRKKEQAYKESAEALFTKRPVNAAE